MSQIKLIGIAPCYNELKIGHLQRFVNHIHKVVDGMVILDDCSTDGSYEYLCENFSKENIIRNHKNLFMYEHYNTQKLIDTALTVYPDLTHILSLNIDSTFSPSCFKDGEALIHKACRDYSNLADMFYMRNINLWRSSCWWRADARWNRHIAERVYIRDKSLNMIDKWYYGLHKIRATAELDSSLCISNLKGFSNAISLHWGFLDKETIRKKFLYYMSLEDRHIPCPEAFHDSNVFNMLDEFNLKTVPIIKEWEDPDINYYSDTRKPKPVSYYKDISKYDSHKGECYKNYFIKRLGFYNEDIEYYNDIIHIP